MARITALERAEGDASVSRAGWGSTVEDSCLLLAHRIHQWTSVVCLTVGSIVVFNDMLDVHLIGEEGHIVKLRLGAAIQPLDTSGAQCDVVCMLSVSDPQDNQVGFPSP